MLVAGNTPSNAPYEGRFVERLVEWWDQSPDERPQLLFRPHPRDGRWRERFAAAPGATGVVVQEASYSDLDDLATLLQHADVVVCNAGTILLDALVGDRPAVCVLYDEGAPPGRVVGGEERRRRALPGARGLGRVLSRGALRGSGRRHRARARAAGGAAAERRRAVEQVVGEVDGRAGKRVVDAILEGVDRSR